MSLAARGARNPDTGVEPIESPGELDRVRRQARRVHLLSIAAAVVLTGSSLWVG